MQSPPGFSPSFDGLPDAVIASSLAGEILYLNRAAETTFGLRREEAIGRHLLEVLFVPSSVEDARLKLRTAVEAGGGSFECVCSKTDGSAVPIDLSLKVVESVDGPMRHVVLSLRDVTEQTSQRQSAWLAAQRQSEEPFRLLIESVKDYAIFMLDPEGRVVSWNLGATRIKGYRADEILGRHFSCFYTPEDVEAGKPAMELRVAAREGRFEDEGWRVRKDGTRFWASVVITAMRDETGQLRRFAKVTRDITERREQYQRIEEANRLKSEFLANMSHELRTPLNAIIGFSELMHDGKVGPVSPDHKEYLGDILTSSRHLLQLINDILDLSKVESGKMEFRPEPVDVARVFGEVCDGLRALSAQKHVQIEAEVDPRSNRIVADPARLKQVLYNFLSNALKFSPDGGRVRVRVAPEGENEFRIEVEDTGIGIKTADIGRLFVEFEQLDGSAARKYPGTGLGLALTKRLVEAQGGRVGVASTPDRGSVFFAVLPRVAAEVPDEARHVR